MTLTIDNSDNALPIEYSEVSITRRMFRDGAGEYEINGASCRLMDVQELLSDSGIGREMHVIVGQGRLAQILESRPEDRRAFIEEAAGVLKHRKRKERPSASWMRWPPTWPADRPDHRTAPPAQTAGPSGRIARRRRPSRPTCATPCCGWPPTTWCAASRVRRRRRHRSRAPQGTKNGGAVEAGGAEPGRGHETAVAACPSAPTRPSRPGSGCRRWPSGSARPCASPVTGPSCWRRTLPARSARRVRIPDDLEARPTRPPRPSRCCSPSWRQARTRWRWPGRTRRGRGAGGHRRRAGASGRRARRGRPPRGSGPAGRSGRDDARPVESIDDRASSGSPAGIEGRPPPAQPWRRPSSRPSGPRRRTRPRGAGRPRRPPRPHGRGAAAGRRAGCRTAGRRARRRT